MTHQKVWFVGVVEDGQTVEAHAFSTLDKANAWLVKYVRTEWNDPEREIPEDDAQAIDEFFSIVSECDCVFQECWVDYLPEGE